MPDHDFIPRELDVYKMLVGDRLLGWPCTHCGRPLQIGDAYLKIPVPPDHGAPPKATYPVHNTCLDLILGRTHNA